MGMENARERRALTADKGFTLMELVVVMMILSVLMAIAGYSYQQWMTRYRVEGQIRKMQVDLMQARLKAMEQKRMYYGVIQSANYQIIEDTNLNETLDPSPGDAHQAAVPLAYASSWSGTLILNTNGQIASSPATTVLSISFDTRGSGPEYDCMLVYPSRISIGAMQGADCVAK